MDLTRAPESVVKLLAWLDAQGAHGVSAPMNDRTNQQGMFVIGEAMTVRVTCEDDRWSAELGRPYWRDWFDADIWRSRLDGEPISLEGSALEEQTRWIEGRWVDLLACDDPELYAGLLAARRDRSFKRLTADRTRADLT